MRLQLQRQQQLIFEKNKLEEKLVHANREVAALQRQLDQLRIFFAEEKEARAEEWRKVAEVNYLLMLRGAAVFAELESKRNRVEEADRLLYTHGQLNQVDMSLEGVVQGMERMRCKTPLCMKLAEIDPPPRPSSAMLWDGDVGAQNHFPSRLERLLGAPKELAWNEEERPVTAN